MESLPNYYVQLFNAVSDALEALTQQNYGLARQILVEGQQRAEDCYLDSDEENENFL